MAATYRTLAINPGSTSTKIALWDDDESVMEAMLSHSADELAAYDSINEQLGFRKEAILGALSEGGYPLASLSAVVGRGGLLYPLSGGTYRVNALMLEDLAAGVMGAHASNLGGILAEAIALEAGRVLACIVDPVVVDERVDEARPSGIPEWDRFSIFHALNQKAVARRAAADLGRPYREVRLVIAHLGGGISVGAHDRGRVIEVNDALNGDGPFGPERSGGLAALTLVDWCFSGTATKADIVKRIKGRGGLVGYLGTNDGREVTRRIDNGDAEAERIYRAMAWQVGREIGSMAAALGTAPDAIVLTGGLAHDARLVGWIRERIDWIAPVRLYPGEDEMRALVEGALRVLRGTETAREYVGRESPEAQRGARS